MVEHRCINTCAVGLASGVVDCCPNISVATLLGSIDECIPRECVNIAWLSSSITDAVSLWATLATKKHAITMSCPITGDFAAARGPRATSDFKGAVGSFVVKK